MIVVTHEMHFAREAADSVVFMEDGVVIEQGPPEQVLNDPRTRRRPDTSCADSSTASEHSFLTP